MKGVGIRLGVITLSLSIGVLSAESLVEKNQVGLMVLFGRRITSLSMEKKDGYTHEAFGIT